VAILFPVALLSSVVLFDFGALIGGFGFFVQVGHWIMATGLVVGVIVLTLALIDLTSTMSGTPAHRIRGAASSALAVMVMAFATVWWARQDSRLDGNAALWLVELFAVGVGAAGAWFARDLAAANRPQPAGPRLGLGDL
jgi:uncharacterized membrane protein